MRIVAASSDHLIIDAGRSDVRVGSEIAFKLNYSALLRAMTSQFVAKVMKRIDQRVDHLRHVPLRIIDLLVARDRHLIGRTGSQKSDEKDDENSICLVHGKLLIPNQARLFG